MSKRDNLDVRWFRAAAPYIHAHRGRSFVLAVPGEAVKDPRFPSLIHDIALLRSLGIRLVLVHGARPQIESRIKRSGSTPRYAQDLRVTDDAGLAAVKEAVGCLRVEIEALLSNSLVNTPMAGARIRVASGNIVTAKPIGVREGVDFCHTGEVRKIDIKAIRDQLELGNIVLLSPIGYSPSGEAFNLRAEDVATATARALQAEKLIFMTEGAERRLPAQMSLSDARDILQRRRSLDVQTRQHLESAVSACSQGVRRTHLIDRRIDGGLLLELYTRDGVGKLITGETYEGLREATVDDVSGVLELITPLEEAGKLVRRSREQLELEIGRFTVIERDGAIIGCAALYPYPDEAVGELACLAVHPEYHDAGRGDWLLSHVEDLGRELGLDQLFVLTTQTPHWFRERGFVAGDIASLPVRRRALYNYQRNSKVLLKSLKAGG